LEELLEPGVEVEIDARDPSSSYAYDAWRQSGSDPAAAGDLDVIGAGPQRDRVPARRRCLHLGDHLAVTFELDNDSCRRLLARLVDAADRLRWTLHHQSAETGGASWSNDRPGGPHHGKQRSSH
jgi:hypothetical protein